MSNVRARKISDLVEAGVSHIGHGGTGLCRDLFDPLLVRGDGDLDHTACQMRARSGECFRWKRLFDRLVAGVRNECLHITRHRPADDMSEGRDRTLEPLAIDLEKPQISRKNAPRI